MTKQLMAGIDLHSNNLTIGIVDQSGKRLKHQKGGLRSQASYRGAVPFRMRPIDAFVEFLTGGQLQTLFAGYKLHFAVTDYFSTTVTDVKKQ